MVQLELTNFPELARFYFQEVMLPHAEPDPVRHRAGDRAGRVRPVNRGFAARALQTLCAQLAQSQYHYRALRSRIRCRTMSC